MKTEITVPAAGEAVTEGDIARWYKADGDYVEMDEIILELETDKASLEIGAEVAGILRITVAEGETVPVGSVIGYIEPGDAPAAKAAPEPEPVAEPEPTPAPEPAVEVAPAPAVSDEGGSSDIASPAARKLLAENDVSAKDVVGTGKGGRITKADVEKFVVGLQQRERILQPEVAALAAASVPIEKAPVISPDETMMFLRRGGSYVALGQEQSEPEQSKAAAKVTIPDGADLGDHSRTVERVKMSRMRRTIASRLIEAQQGAALLSTFNEVDMGPVMAIRARHKDEYREKHGTGLSFMTFFTKAVALALQEFPDVNAMIDGEEIVYQHFYDIGIAVATPKGLVVPVVRDADKLSFQQVDAEIVRLAKKGRDGKMTLDELAGGTFSITNGGVFGSMLSTPIVNRPQSAILGMHNIVERPVVKDGQVVVAPIMYVALTYDHRIIDGSTSVRFLVKIKKLIEEPTRLMLDL
jgi:2-oxoglutarate dehydrogenase E2 component (dihydrolipoamide succinyltransferase)